MPPAENGTPLLELVDVEKHFTVRKGLFAAGEAPTLRAVDGVSFGVARGETLGVVGETGCGKSTMARMIARLYTPDAGEVRFDGQEIGQLSNSEFKPLRRRIQMIFQDPFDSLNPRQDVGTIVATPLRLLGQGKREAAARVEELFELVGLSRQHLSRYSYELSGGQRQRVGIARALAPEPDLIVCDEPVSALDVSVQAQVVNLLEDLQEQLGLTYVFIGHDLAVVRQVCDRIAVMYLGRIVEIAGRDALYEQPQHPYTQALLSAAPIPDPGLQQARSRRKLAGEPPSPTNPPSGCRFHTRCWKAQEICTTVDPPPLAIAGSVQVACHFPEERFPSEPAAVARSIPTRKVGMPTEELTVVNDGIELHGTFVTPAGDGPFPAMLALHGASEGTREARLMRHLQEVLPANGIAVLTYDRRGHGASVVPPEATAISFEDKASDARAWLDLLQRHSAVDGERVGIWGHSQGGWLGPMAAVGHDDVALMALVAPCAVTPAEQMQFGYGYQIRQAGYAEEDAQRGIELRRLVDAYWRGDGVSEEEAIAAIDAAKDEPWFDIAPPVDPRLSGGGWRTEMDLDIVPTLAQLAPMPLLLIFGERDQWVPTVESEARWRGALPADADLTVETLPGTTHFPTPDHDGEGPLAPRYEELLVGWLRSRFGLDAADAR